MAGQFNIRRAEFGDVRELSLVLAGAFEEDPFMSWLFPESKHRFKFAQAWMRVEVENALEMDASWVSMISGEIVAGTIWSPPGRDLHESGTFNQLWYLVLGANPDRTSELAQGLSMIGSGHPEEPHFYLNTVGVQPSLAGHQRSALPTARRAHSSLPLWNQNRAGWHQHGNVLISICLYLCHE